MKSLKSTIAIFLLALTTVFAGSNTKMVNSENINGKITPVVILKTIEISADKNIIKINGGKISNQTFASPEARLVQMAFINNKMVPLVNLKTVEVTASRNEITSQVNSADKASLKAENQKLVKTTLFNGEIMPTVDLNVAEVIASRTEQNIAGNLTSNLIKFFTSTFVRF